MGGPGLSLAIDYTAAGHAIGLRLRNARGHGRQRLVQLWNDDHGAWGEARNLLGHASKQ